MPTPIKTTENIRKHLSKAERKVRESIEKQLEPRSRVYIRAPKWLSKDAKEIFESTKRRMRGLKLLDNMDTDLLAMYSDALVKYQTEEGVREKQAWSRVALSYAEKLGISPAARARLAKKSAEQVAPDDLEQLLDDVKDYVNSGDR